MDKLKATKSMKKYKKRISREFEKNKIDGDFDFAHMGDVLWYFRFTVQDGLYNGQLHIVEIKLVYGCDPNMYIYPVFAPLCRFVTPIWHPNISDTGTICLDVLDDNWSPSMHTSSIINALKLLLLNPEPSSPQNTDAAKMMVCDPTAYKKYISEHYNYSSIPDNIQNIWD
jgi:ubiquitin-protein ligase